MHTRGNYKNWALDSWTGLWTGQWTEIWTKFCTSIYKFQHLELDSQALVKEPQAMQQNLYASSEWLWVQLSLQAPRCMLLCSVSMQYTKTIPIIKLSSEICMGVEWGKTLISALPESIVGSGNVMEWAKSNNKCVFMHSQFSWTQVTRCQHETFTMFVPTATYIESSRTSALAQAMSLIHSPIHESTVHSPVTITQILANSSMD